MGKLFGTNGVRGYANQDMNAELALHLGQSLGTFLPQGSSVLIGTDTRTSGHLLKSALSAGLLSAGIRVCDAGVTPTPALQYAVKHGAHAAGIVITASHNPPEFNGIKFIDGDGTEFPSSKEDEVEDFFFSKKFRTVTWDAIPEHVEVPGVNDAYVAGVIDKVDAARIRARKFRVVLDTSNGAGSLTAPYLLRALGCHVITLNCQPDGTFPGHDSEPTPENVRDLVTATKAFGADLGIVQDGDADRCVFVSEQGEYVYGDRTLAMVAGHLVRENKGGVIATPVSSSSIVEEHVKAAGGTIEYTRVGAPIVARRMIEIGALFGGEENGGLIFPEHQHCRDASMTLAKVLEILAVTGRPLSTLLAEVPTKSLVKTKVACPDGKKQSALDAFAAAHAKDRVDRTDGVKVYVADGWVLVRPSGTEPIYRVYAEGSTPKAASDLAARMKAEIEAIIAKV